METYRHCRRCHHALAIAKFILQTATVVTGILAVHELDRIHHRMKKIEKKEQHHLL